MGSKKGKADVARLLIEAGAHVNEQPDGIFSKGTPLHLAAEEGKAGVARLLIEEGADVNTTGDRGLTPLHLAAERGNTTMVQLLIKAGADVNANPDNLFGSSMGTALHFAAEQGKANVVQMLIEAGANVNALNTSGITPVRLAKNRGHQDVVRLLRGGSATNDPFYKWAMFVSVLFLIIVLVLLASR